MRQWTVEDLAKTQWFADLMDRVQAEVNRMDGSRAEPREAMTSEISRLKQQVDGWVNSLSKPDLATLTRKILEESVAAAMQQIAEREQQMRQQDGRAESVRHAVDPAAVVDRLNRLGDVLSANNPARVNIELAQHIDVITCFKNRRVIVRMCKLGELSKHEQFVSRTPQEVAPRPVLGLEKGRKGRRLALRAVKSADADEECVREAAEFATDLQRFNGLGPEWFWEDEFVAPEAPCWSKDNALIVAGKRREMRWSHKLLAKFFGKSEETIKAALRYAKQIDPSLSDLPQKMWRPRWETSHYEEVWRMRCKPMTIKRIADHFSVSSGTIRAAISLAKQKFGIGETGPDSP